MAFYVGKGGVRAIKGTKGFISGRNTAAIQAAVDKYYKLYDEDVRVVIKKSISTFISKKIDAPKCTGNLRDSIGAAILDERGFVRFDANGTLFATKMQHWVNPQTLQNEKGYGHSYRLWYNRRQLYIKGAKLSIGIFAAIPYALSLTTGLTPDGKTFAGGRHRGWFRRAANEFGEELARNVALAMHGTLIHTGSGDLGYAYESLTGI